ncbi:MAG: DUF4350 domain-containing protein [Solirubrobacteraceae bacterium]
MGLLALFALLEGIGALLPGPSGPRSSSYATATNGAAAYAELLQRTGHPISRLRGRLDTTPVDSSTTLVVLDPDVIVAPEAEALKRFVTAGGRLVVGARDPGTWLRELIDRPPKWSDEGPRTARPTGASSAEFPGVGTVRSAGDGTWLGPGSTHPLLQGPGGALAVARTVGSGKLFLFADPSPLQNRLLGEADDAALGAALAGEQGRPVAFLESVHGYGRGRGLGALPDSWRWALAGLVLAALVWLASHARRLGPPEREGRELPPARRVYIDAIATLLARTGDLPRASAAVAGVERDRLLRRATLPADAGDEAVLTAAERLGLAPDEARALNGIPTNEEEARAAGRALALLERGRP